MMIDNMIAYAEIDEILNLLEDEYKNKVPENIRNLFKEEKMKDYTPKIDENIPLIEQNLKRETIVLLSILNLNYWCEDEEEKQYFLDQLAENEREKKELEEKYNPDNLFKKENNSNVDNQVKENMQMVEYKPQNVFMKMLNIIFSFFKKNK